MLYESHIRCSIYGYCLIVGGGRCIRLELHTAKSCLKLKSARQRFQAKKIIDEGIKQAETKKKELLLEAKEDIIRAKNDNERDMKERRTELNQLEKRLVSKEESLDKKMESLEHRSETLNRKIKENSDLQEEIKKIRDSELSRLEHVAGLTAAEAKEEMLSKIESEVRHETAMRIIEIESEMQRKCGDESEGDYFACNPTVRG